MQTNQPQFAVFFTAERFGDLDLGVSERLHLAAAQHKAGLPGVEEVKGVSGPAVGGDRAVVGFRSPRRSYRSPPVAPGERGTAVSLPTVAETLILTNDVYRAMVDRALTETPNEACGLFTGAPGGLWVDGYHPMTNAADPDEAWKLYLLDGQEMLDVEAAADADGRAVLGVMHSHTHTEAYPSPTDVADASRFDPFGAWVFVIVSLQHPDPVLRAYRILDGEITEVLVEVERG